MLFKELLQNSKQEFLACNLNVSQQCISSWIKGRTVPNLEKISLISKLLNCSIDEVVLSLLETQKQNATKNKQT